MKGLTFQGLVIDMSRNFDIRNYFNNLFLEAEEEEAAQQQQPQPQQAPQQQQQAAPQQGQPPAKSSEAFRSLQGQTIAGVSFSPNGSTGGTIKIKVKNSYIPFTISWVNQQVTVVDTQGNSIVLGDDQQ